MFFCPWPLTFVRQLAPCKQGRWVLIFFTPWAPHDTHPSEPMRTLTWGWEHTQQPESRLEECQWTSCPQVPSGQKEMPSQLQGKEQNDKKQKQKPKTPMIKLHTVDNFQVRVNWHFMVPVSMINQTNYRKYISHS